MNEADKLHLSDWFNAAVAVAAVVFGGLLTWLFSWINGRRSRMAKRLEDFDKLIVDIHKQIARHDELLAVTEANIENIKDNLVELKDQTKIQTQLLHDIILKVRG